MRPIIAATLLVAIMMPAPADAGYEIPDVCEFSTSKLGLCDLDPKDITPGCPDAQADVQPCGIDPVPVDHEVRELYAAARQCAQGTDAGGLVGLIQENCPGKPPQPARCDILPIVGCGNVPGSTVDASASGVGCQGTLSYRSKTTTIGVAVGTWFLLGYQKAVVETEFRFNCEAELVIGFEGAGDLARTVQARAGSAPIGECRYDGIIQASCIGAATIPLGSGSGDGVVGAGEDYPTSARYCTNPVTVENTLAGIPGTGPGMKLGSCFDVPITYQVLPSLQAVLDNLPA